MFFFVAHMASGPFLWRVLMESELFLSIPTNSNGPEFLPELENHPFPVLGRNFSPRARFPIQAKFLVLQQNSEKHPWVDFRKFGREFPGLGREFPGIGQQKTRS